MQAHSGDISHTTTLISARHIFSQVAQHCSGRALSELYEMSRTFCLPESLILEIPAAIFWPISARFSVQQRLFQRHLRASLPGFLLSPVSEERNAKDGRMGEA